MDALASSLMDAFRVRSGEFWGRVPSLSDVLSALARRNQISREAVELVSEIEDLIKSAYDEDFNDAQREEAAELIEELQKVLLSELSEAKSEDE